MDDIEHRIVTAGSEIGERARALAKTPDEMRKADAGLAEELEEALAVLRLAARQLESIASSWHYVDR